MAHVEIPTEKWFLYIFSILLVLFNFEKINKICDYKIGLKKCDLIEYITENTFSIIFLILRNDGQKGLKCCTKVHKWLKSPIVFLLQLVVTHFLID